jgi:hypothetical protein
VSCEQDKNIETFPLRRKISLRLCHFFDEANYSGAIMVQADNIILDFDPFYCSSSSSREILAFQGGNSKLGDICVLVINYSFILSPGFQFFCYTTTQREKHLFLTTY